MQSAILQRATEFIHAIKNNDLQLFTSSVASQKIDQIRSLIGYLSGSGIETTTSEDEYLLITIDMLNENLMEYLGDDCFETMQISIINETKTTAVAILSANGCSVSMPLINENNSWKIAHFDHLDDE